MSQTVRFSPIPNVVSAIKYPLIAANQVPKPEFVKQGPARDSDLLTLKMHLHTTSPKILLLGRSQTGKSSFISRYLTQHPHNHLPTILNTTRVPHITTIGSDPEQLKVNISMLEFTEIGGTVDNCNELLSSEIANTDAIIILYDITSKYSFASIFDYHSSIISYGNQRKVPIIVVGNKTDLQERMVPYEMGQALEKELGVVHMESNNKRPYSAIKVVDKIIEMYLQTNRPAAARNYQDMVVFPQWPLPDSQFGTMRYLMRLAEHGLDNQHDLDDSNHQPNNQDASDEYQLPMIDRTEWNHSYSPEFGLKAGYLTL